MLQLTCGRVWVKEKLFPGVFQLNFTDYFESLILYFWLLPYFPRGRHRGWIHIFDFFASFLMQPSHLFRLRLFRPPEDGCVSPSSLEPEIFCISGTYCYFCWLWLYLINYDIMHERKKHLENPKYKTLCGISPNLRHTMYSLRTLNTAV